jgi:nitroreductase
MGDERPSREDVAGLLEAAVMAPTHHMTQPWRFIVLAGAAREELGTVMGERVRRELPDDPHLAYKVAAEAGRTRKAPVIIVVVYVPSDHPKAIEHEDRYAVGAAMQNLMLAAHALGLATFLRTGPASLDAGVAAHLGLAAGGEGGRPPEEIAGFIYLGTAQGEPPAAKARAEASERTTWLGWDAASANRPAAG